MNNQVQMSCTYALWRRQHHFRTIRKFALTGGTLLFGIVGLVHFPGAKYAVDVGDSIPEDCSIWRFTAPLMHATFSGQSF